MVLITMTTSTDGCKSSQVPIVTEADSRILNLYLASARFISIDVFGGGGGKSLETPFELAASWGPSINVLSI